MRLNAITNAEFLAALTLGVYTRQELVDEVGLHYGTVGDYLDQLHKRGLVHIVEWRRSEDYWHITPVFKLGAGKDVPRPRRKSMAERQRDCYARKKARLMQLAMTGQASIELAANGRLRVTPNVRANRANDGATGA